MTTEHIREALEGAGAYLRAHPDEALYTDSVATARIEEGLRVRVEGPDGASLITDMPGSIGGGGAAPSPGWVLRAALAACEATFIAMEAARVGVDMDGLEVSVDSESDDRGVLGLDQAVPAGPLSVRVTVRVRPDAGDAGDLGVLVERAADRCPVHDAVARPVPVTVIME